VAFFLPAVCLIKKLKCFFQQDANVTSIIKRKRKTNLNGMPKPKRVLTGYLKYAASVHSEVKAALLEDLEDGGKLQPQAVVREIAIRWKAETEELREAWNKDAKSASSEGSDPESE